MVGKGVETADLRDSLEALGCRLGQGFHFSRAIYAIEMAGLLGGGPAVQAIVDPADAA